MAETNGRWLAADSLFVACVVLLATGYGLLDLGFHSDDWALIAELALAPDQSLAGGFAALKPHDRAIRPLQFGLLALVHRTFGTGPLPYHIAQFGLVLASAVLLLHLLRKLGLTARVALATAVVWAVLPHHSSARLWVAAAQVPLAATAYLAHVLADLRAAERSGWGAVAWRLLSGVAALASLFSYEIFLPFILATPFLTRWWRRGVGRTAGGHEARARPPRSGGLDRAAQLAPAPGPDGGAEPGRPVPFPVAAAPAFAAVALALAAKVLWQARLPTWTFWHRFLRGGRTYLEIAVEDATVYGLRAPLTLWRAALEADPLGVAMALTAGAAVFVYLLARRPGLSEGPPALFEGGGSRALSAGGSPVSPGTLLVAGLGAHVGGYAVGFLTGGFGSGPTGLNNRAAMAASLGVALVLCALAALAARRAGGRAGALFAAAIALVVASSGVANAAITEGWVAAAGRQEEVLDGIRDRLPDVRGIDYLLVAGVCRYEGPGIVLGSPWGVSGFLRLAYGTPAIAGDVVAPGTRVDGSGVRTELYREVSLYPFRGLVGYDHRGGRLVTLGDSTAAAAFVRRALEGDARTGCEGEPGRGAPIF